MPLEHKRAVGDTLSEFAVQLTRNGTPVDLTGLTVTFEMYNAGGSLVATGAANISNAIDGDVEYDFQPADVTNAGTYFGYFIVSDGSDEPDTYPIPNDDDDDNGIIITIFDRAGSQVEPEPSIDIMGMANAPIRTRTVEGTVEERTINELIRADQYTASKDAASQMPWGIRVARTRPGGMTT